MTPEEKVKYFTIAANICGFGFNEKHTDMLLSVYEKIIEKEGKTDLEMVCKIIAECEEREQERQKMKNEQTDKI